MLRWRTLASEGWRVCEGGEGAIHKETPTCNTPAYFYE